MAELSLRHPPCPEPSQALGLCSGLSPRDPARAGAGAGALRQLPPSGPYLLLGAFLRALRFPHPHSWVCVPPSLPTRVPGFSLLCTVVYTQVLTGRLWSACPRALEASQALSLFCSQEPRARPL